MSDPATAAKRVLIEEVLLGGGDGALMLRKPVLVEAGQRYWVDGSDLVVEANDGRQERFHGDYETRCYGW
jgi:hypothetical protein